MAVPRVVTPAAAPAPHELAVAGTRVDVGDVLVAPVAQSDRALDFEAGVEFDALSRFVALRRVWSSVMRLRMRVGDQDDVTECDAAPPSAMTK
jgi:hypothetical protein